MIIYNVITNGNITDQKMYDLFLQQLENIQHSEDELKDNYLLDRMDLPNHKSLDMLLDGDNVVCFSGLYHRPSWPSGFYRISNRTYVVPKYRTSSYNFINPSNIGPFQVERYKSDIRLAFISRENAKGRFYFKKLQRVVDYYTDWNISDRMVQLVNSESKSSYQYIIHKSFGQSSLSEFKSISEQQWRELV